MPQDRISIVGTNIAEKATMIWNVADMLRGPFKPHEYGLVILPMTVVKRFHDCLLPTWQAVQDTYEKFKKLAVIEGFLKSAAGYQFYNTSKFTFDKLLADPQNIEANFRDYLAGFSANVQDVLSKFDFDNVIKRMVESNTLYLTIKEFNSPKGYLGADKISAVDCGYIFEDLVRRFSESFGEEAGAHFTSRDIIYLMTDLLLSGANLNQAASVNVYDMAMGTSQMLSCMEERVHDINADIDVLCFGQEFNPSTFAIAKADMMIRGGDPNNMRFGDTLSDDQFSGYHFDFCISNPPFGIDWKREQKAVEREHKRGELGRFAPGLPKISDGQQLFVLNGLSKLTPTGKMAIIQNGSPLFSGDAGSGSSEIRRYILENDWLDAIVQLSTDQFMNTGISTYIWICSKDKPAHRAGKVQLIDASHCYEPRRKSIGTKRNDITDHCRRLIVQAYDEFKNNFIYGDKAGVHCQSKIFNTEDFGYYKIVVERPQLDEHGKPVLKRGKPVADVELQGWIRRLEITINDAEGNSKTNAGWHPHFHAIIMVPRDKLQRLSDVEQEWRDAWVASVCKHFEKTFGKKIDESFLPAFREHGLVFSRYKSGPFKGQLRPVDDGSYLAKIMGYDNAHVFGGDSEMTDSALKDSKIPFDLLRDSSLPAGNIDLWVEYAFATKGVPAIKFSNGLEDKVNAYFAENPEQDKSSYKIRSTEVVVASLSNAVHQLLYRNFLIGDLCKKTAEGYDSLCSWLKETFVELGVPELCECPFAMPRPPT